MYIFYQHSRDASGKIVLTELKLSSYAHRWAIQWNNVPERAIFELLKVVLKYPPTIQRTYNESSKVWTYIGDWGTQVLQRASDVTKAVKPVVLTEVTDIQYIAQQVTFDLTKLRPKIRPEDFFYQQAPTQSANALTKESVTDKLATLLGVDKNALNSAQNGELKKLYRQAALKYHPDRNAGDGSKMSELNMLWEVFNG